VALQESRRHGCGGGDLLRRGDVSFVRGDHYSAEWSREVFRKRGIA
jgi:hypothetical protein